MEQLRVGVIGAGRMGQRHCRIYANLRRVTLAGVCDSFRQSGEQTARQYDAPFYTSLEDLLANVDAVSIATPTPSHFDLARQCLEYGVHVLIEKPIAETLEQAEALARIAEASGRVAMIGHIERFNPAYIELKNVLEGLRVLAVNFRRLSAVEGSNKDVDVVMDLMIHDTNLVLDLMGRAPDRLSAFGLTAFSGTIDHAVAQLGYDGGPLLSLTASRITEHKVRTIEVTAREAYVECDLLNKSILVHRQTVGEYLQHNHRGVKYRQESIVERIQVPVFEPLFLELQHFVECVLEGKAPSVTARDGLRAMELVERVRGDILTRMVDLQSAPAVG